MQKHNHSDRLRRLQNLLTDYNVEALLIENSINLFYLTGLHLSAGSLYISSQQVFLIVDGRYYTACNAGAPCPVLLLEDHTFEELHKKYAFKTLGIDKQATTVARLEQLSSLLTNCEIVPVDHPLLPLRMIKEEYELDLLRESAKLCSLGYDYVVSLLHPGVKEKEIAAELEIFWLQHGGEGLAFSPIIAFGAHSSLPHHRAGESTLKPTDIALIDIGVLKNSYHSDMTRTLLFGQVPEKIKEIYQVVQEAQQAALERCRAGITTGELDQTARQSIIKNGYGDYFSHGLGHGVGLEIHEYPFLRNKTGYADTILKPGMVVTIEPGIYLPALGGVRLENTVIIQEAGFEDLTLRPT